MKRFAQRSTKAVHELAVSLMFAAAFAWVPACTDSDTSTPPGGPSSLVQNETTTVVDAAPSEHTDAEASEASVVVDAPATSPVVDAALATESATPSTDDALVTAEAALDAAPSLDAAQTDTTTVVPTACRYEDGTAIPYDHTRGIVEEHAFNISLSCELGEFISPLIAADPDGLTKVLEFDDLLTSWLRQHVLQCQDEVAPVDSAFALLPPAEATNMSQGDFDAVVELFMQSVDHQDGTPAAMSDAQKTDLRQRLKAFAPAAVKNGSADLTHRLQSPDCEIPDVDAGTD